MVKVNEAEKFKHVFKEALTETFQEQRDLLREIIAEAIEDIALAKAVRDGRKTPPVSRAEVMRLLKGSA